MGALPSSTRLEIRPCLRYRSPVMYPRIFSKMRRIARGAVLVAGLLATTPAIAGGAPKTILLGVDGLDPHLLQQFVDAGTLPNFARMIETGDFKPLQTSMPPLSPVAWATFITGMDPGGHGLFDFVHRDPATLVPFLSMSKATPPEKTLQLGSYVLPLSGGTVENLRDGTTFWQILESNGIPTTVFRCPANFPPAESPGKAFSGMGTPDILGTPGMFSFYTDRPPPRSNKISGGRVYPVEVHENVVRAALRGPRNTFRQVPGKRHKKKMENPELLVDFTVYRDAKNPVARIKVQDNDFILKEGEWSDWVRVDFTALKVFSSISAIARFYLKQAHPDFELYVTPLQINPEDPAMPIATPASWSHELCEELGYFYTQELPEDTKAFSSGIFTGNEFWTQSQFVFTERRRALDYFLKTFEEGLLFFYFSSVDQGCHMLWQYMDADHPAHSADPQLAKSVETIYRGLDESLGQVLKAAGDDTTVIVMSDHGFCPFYRGVNLNTWLYEKGYVTLRNPARQGQFPLFANVDWTRTRAYAMGLNGLYVNLKGREKNGIVEPGEAHTQLLDELEKELRLLRDPENDQPAVTLTVRPRRDFHGKHAKNGPDIIVGYNSGYRSSWESPLGEFPKDLFVDNHDAWSGDHAVDYRHVPGVLLTNRKITLEEPALYDLTVAILALYGVPKTSEMIGSNCLE